MPRFRNAKQYRRKLEGIGIYSALTDYADNYCTWTDKSCKNKQVFSVVLKLPRICSRLDEEVEPDAILELLKYTFATKDEIPALLQTPASLDKVKMLLDKMKHSKWFVAAQKPVVAKKLLPKPKPAAVAATNSKRVEGAKEESPSQASLGAASK